MQRVSCGSLEEIHHRAAGAGSSERCPQGHEVRGASFVFFNEMYMNHIKYTPMQPVVHTYVLYVHYCYFKKRIFPL